jgi:two-component system, OmpR family, sensor histidine kinase SenX3
LNLQVITAYATLYDAFESPSVNVVNNTLSFVLTALVSFVGGALIAWALLREVRRDKQDNDASSQPADSASDLLDVLASAGILLNGSNTVVRSTKNAQALGLIQSRMLAHDSLVDLVNSARVADGPCEVELELSTGLQSEPVWVSARAVHLTEGNVLLTVEDETEAKRLEETRRDFVANISHELKTPIGAISLLSEALVDAAEDPKMVKKFSTDLIKESKRLANLVQEIIQLSRLQSTDVIKNAQVLDLRNVILEAIERNSVLAERRAIRISADAPAGIFVLGDQEMLTVAVKNLIENAITYSDEGKQVGIGLRKKHGVAAIAVTDNGIGMTPEQQERVFERFYRADASRSRQTGGTGLGLAIVKHVSATHLGDVQVFSKPGVGSTFTLRLPVASVPAEEEDDE